MPGEYLFEASTGGSSYTTPFIVDPVPQAQTISGLVTDGVDPVAGAIVVLEDALGTAALTTTGPDGSYLLDVPIPGDYLLFPASLQGGYYTDFAGALDITVGAGANLAGQNLTLGVGDYPVSGTVGDSTGLSGLWMEAEGLDTDSFAIGLSGPGGAYTLWLPAGEFEIGNVPDDDFGTSPSAKGYVGYAAELHEVNVSAPVTGEDFAVTPATVAVSGTVVDTGGFGLPGLPVSANLYSTPGEPAAVALTDEAGHFTLGLIDGSNWIVGLDNEIALRSDLLGSQLWLDTATDPLSGLEITAYPVTASIDVTLEDAGGTPLEQMDVYARNSDWSIVSDCETVETGQCTLAVLAGDWWVGAWVEDDGYAPITEVQVTLADSETDTVSLVAQPNVFEITAPTSGESPGR